MFGVLTKKSAIPGLTAIDMQADGVGVVRIVRGSGRRPTVTLCDFRPWEGLDGRAPTLARIAADYGLARARCTTLLPEGAYSLLLTEAPDVPPEELRAAVRWRIKDLIDFHVNDATVDVIEVPADKAAGRSRAIYAVAARNEAIRRCAEAITGAGINLDVIDIAEMAQRNLAALLPDDAQGVLVLSLGAGNGLITITRRGEMYLSRSLDIGLDALGAPGNEGRELDRVVLEIQRSLDYYDGHFRQPPIARLYVAPMGRAVPGLLEHLGTNLDVDVAEMRLDALLSYEAQMPPALEGQCLMAIGAALREEAAAT